MENIKIWNQELKYQMFFKNHSKLAVVGFVFRTQKIKGQKQNFQDLNKLNQKVRERNDKKIIRKISECPAGSFVDRKMPKGELIEKGKYD